MDCHGLLLAATAGLFGPVAISTSLPRRYVAPSVQKAAKRPLLSPHAATASSSHYSLLIRAYWSLS